MVKIYLDAGHGGSDPGATGNGLREKDLTLDIASRIKKHLDDNYSGHTIKMSRTTDTTVSLAQRTNDANRWGEDFFLSVHINAGGGTGYEDYIYNGLSNSSKTAKLRDTIHAEIIKAIGSVTNRGKKKANFHVLRESKMAAILTENLFIDTKADADKLKSSSFLNKVAKGHAVGLAKALGLKKKSKPNKKPSKANAYTVKKGDTLSGIASKYKTTVSVLAKLNNIKNVNLIHPGQKIKLPSATSKKKTTKSKSFKVGQTVTLKKSAKRFATGERIADFAKGKKYKIIQVKSDRVLLDQIMSWVKKADVS